MGKAPAGTVVVRNQGGRLRLVFSYLSRRYFLSLKLVDQPSSRAIAKRIAAQIEQDMALHQFDPTLRKYKKDDRPSTVHEMFERFLAHKGQYLAPTTLVKYRAISNYLIETRLGLKPIDAVTDEDCFKFKDWLSHRIKPPTLRDRLTIVKACWEWEGINPNPWREVLKATKSPSVPPPKPFTVEELEKILSVCRSDFPFYADFLEAWAILGCRPGELIGLQWEHIAKDCKTIWLGSQLTRRGERKAAKANKSEAIKIPARLVEILSTKKRGSPKSLVFTNGAGNQLSDTNFRSRVWKRILDKCELPYRKPYSLRATAITRFIESGMQPADVARITRNSVRVIYSHYLGSTTPEVSVPDITSD